MGAPRDILKLLKKYLVFVCVYDGNIQEKRGTLIKHKHHRFSYKSFKVFVLCVCVRACVNLLVRIVCHLLHPICILPKGKVIIVCFASSLNFLIKEHNFFSLLALLRVIFAFAKRILPFHIRNHPLLYRLITTDLCKFASEFSNTTHTHTHNND